MKMIDEKGKLFGKINVIDFLVILFLLCIFPAFYYGYKIMNRKVEVETTTEEFIEIETDCLFIKLKPEVLKLISVGDKELDEEGEVIGEIVRLGKSKPYKYEVDIGSGQELVIKKDVPLKQINAKLKLKAEIRQNGLYYKNIAMKIGLLFEFNTNKYKVMGLLPKDFIKGEKGVEVLEERTIDLFVTLKDLDEDTLKQISVGDKERDEDGQIIAEVLSLGAIEKSSHEFAVGVGNFVRVEDPSKKQISTKMRLKCQIKDDERGKQLYFKGQPIEHNKTFEFKTDKYTTDGVVAKAFEVISPLKEKWVSLQLKLSGVAPEIASVIQKEDVEKDPSDAVVAKIRSIISNQPAQVLILRDKDFISLNHPFNREILLYLDVKCTEKEGVYYFKNYPVKMGNNLVFATDLYSVAGTLVGLEIK